MSSGPTFSYASIFTSPSPVNLSNNGYNQPVTATATDKAGNIATKTVFVSINLGMKCPAPNQNGANLRGGNLEGCYLANTNLSGDNLQSANVSYASLAGVNLKGDNLQSANLANANLSGANLSGTALQGSNVKGANLLSVITTGITPSTLSGCLNNPVCH